MKRRTGRRWTLPLLLTLTILGACVPGSRGAGARAAPTNRAVVVRVTNNSWDDLIVYLGNGDGRFRLGKVPGMTTHALSIPNAVIGGGTGLQLVAGPRNAPHAHGSAVFDVAPGRSIWWTIEPRSELSPVSVR
jgi:hypothetical protein